MFDKEQYTKNRSEGKKGIDFTMTIDGYLPEEYSVYVRKTTKAERRGFTTKRERNA